MAKAKSEILIDGIPAKDIAASLIRSGRAIPPDQETYAEAEARKKRRRKQIRDCMRRKREAERDRQMLLHLKPTKYQHDLDYPWWLQWRGWQPPGQIQFQFR